MNYGMIVAARIILGAGVGLEGGKLSKRVDYQFGL